MTKLILLLFLPFASFAQNKFDNTIVINEFVSMDKLKSSLFDAGFILQGTDTSYLETNEVKQKKNEVYIKLKMKRTDSSVVIKGIMKINVSISLGGVTVPPEYEPIEYWKSKSSLPRVSFDVMDKFAKSLSINITYQKN